MAKNIAGERIEIQGAGEKLLRYPLAEKNLEGSMKARGTYRKGYPEGAIVHWTSGHSKRGEKDARNTVEGGIRNGYMFFVIDIDGRVYQNFNLNKWGYHAGSSSWKGLGSGVSQYLVGIEISNAGSVKKQGDKYVSWFGQILTESEVRHAPKSVDNIQRGIYHKYTKEQEASLTALLLWLKRNNPSVFNLDLVLGHDEVAPSRKNDPGASLSMSMPKYREYLKAELKK